MPTKTDPQLTNKLRQLLDHHAQAIIADSLRQIRIHGQPLSEEDKLYKQACCQVKGMLNLVDRYLQNPDDLEHLKDKSRKIARQDVFHQGDIGDFVHNINVGRCIAHQYIRNSSLSTSEQYEAVRILDKFFNFYSYTTVTEISLLKDSIIREQNEFIQEMHGDRLTILGQIAASFVHEFRNPLTSIKGFISLLEEEYGEIPKTKHYFSVMNREMKRLQDIVSHFLLLSKAKGFEDQIEPFNLREAIEEVTDFMYPRFVEENIQVVLDVENDLMFLGVKDQIKQVIMNIISNAAEELTKREGRRKILVEGKQESSTLSISITNNGPPIPAHLIQNIFQPFITTKELGTGLGLSVCKQIVEKHNGTIDVSTNEKETTFRIVFSDYSGK